jgi:hypothetical protein
VKRQIKHLKALTGEAVKAASPVNAFKRFTLSLTWPAIRRIADQRISRQLLSVLTEANDNDFLSS